MKFDNDLLIYDEKKAITNHKLLKSHLVKKMLAKTVSREDLYAILIVCTRRTQPPSET